MNTSQGFEENGATVFAQVREVVDNLDEFLPEPAPLALFPMRRRIKDFLAEALGDESWRKCTLLVQAMPNGDIVYTASRICIACGTIHTYIVTVDETGEFDVASPSPLGRHD